MTNRAKLAQGKIAYIFEYDPQGFSVGYTMDLAANQVLDSHDPDIRSKSTTTTYKLDRCLLVSAGLNTPQGTKLKALESLILSREPCRFSYGTVSVGMVYITSGDFNIKSWVGGQPAHVEINLTLRSARELPKGGKNTIGNVTSPTRGALAGAGRTVNTTARMREDYTKQVQDYLKVPAQLKRLGLTAPVTVSVADDKVVTLTSGDRQSIHTLSEFGVKP